MNNGTRWPRKALLFYITDCLDNTINDEFVKLLNQWTLNGCTGFVAFERSRFDQIVNDITEPQKNLDIIQVFKAKEVIDGNWNLKNAVTLITCEAKDTHSTAFTNNIMTSIKVHDPLISVIAHQAEVTLNEIIAKNLLDIPQSFEFRQGHRIPRDRFHEYPLLALWFHSASTRRDHSSQFSVQNIFENNGNNCISVYQYLAEILYPLGLTKKYGA